MFLNEALKGADIENIGRIEEHASKLLEEYAGELWFFRRLQYWLLHFHQIAKMNINPKTLLSPVANIKILIRADASLFAFLPAALFGVISQIEIASVVGLAQSYSTSVVVFTCLIGGVLWGLAVREFLLFTIRFLMSITGGTVTYNGFRNLLSYAYFLPWILSFPTSMLIVAFTGFKHPHDQFSIPALVFGLHSTVFGVFAFIVYSRSASALHGCSFFRSALCSAPFFVLASLPAALFQLIVSLVIGESFQD